MERVCDLIVIGTGALSLPDERIRRELHGVHSMHISFSKEFV